MSTEPLTILLVEADDALLENLRHLLESDGYRILTANSGDTALQAAQLHGQKIDALVTDATSPTSGLELAVAVATANSHVTVILTVAPPFSIENSQCQICRKAAGHFLSKPFTYAHLRSKLEQLSVGTDVSALEWLFHLYDQSIEPNGQGKVLSGAKNERVPGIVLQLEAVGQEETLFVKGSLTQADGSECACLIEPQIQTLRAWRKLRLRDFEHKREQVVRLVVRPAPGEQNERRVQPRRRRRRIARWPSSNIIPELSGAESKEILPLEHVEKAAILSALTILAGNKIAAAKKLGIALTTLYRKLHEYGICNDSERLVSDPRVEIVGRPLNKEPPLGKVGSN